MIIHADVSNHLKMKTINFIGFFLLLTIHSFSQDIIVQILYQKNENNTAWTAGIDEITIRQNRKIIKKIITNSDGIGKIPKAILIDSKNYDLSLTSIGIQENYLITINKSIIDTIFIRFPKDYRMRFGYAICPICNKANAVCKISMEPILVRTIVEGDTILSPIFKRTYYLGTDVGHEFNPNWYCKRDSIKF